jgi:hypothetical protein
VKKGIKTPDYVGPERRSGVDRRETPDRRQSVRWEPEKSDRRRRPKRRKSDRDVWDHIDKNDSQTQSDDELEGTKNTVRISKKRSAR